MTRSAKDEIIEILKQSFKISHLEIQDKTSDHASHIGAQKSGGGHFVVTIVSDQFKGQSILERHRMVYEVLKQKFKSQIHALAIKAMTPQEFHR